MEKMDCSMRDYSEFCEQLNDIRVRFHKWDSCEKTVALYYLMVGLPFANAKFLQHALEQCICAASTPEAQVMEHNANDPLFISSLSVERRQVALSAILTHLPLLKPGNKEAADCYLNIIKQVLTEFITPPYKIYNECVEIMSYVFVHPAFNKDDKKSFRQLLRHVLNRVSPDTFVHSPVAESSDESVSPNPDSNTLNVNSERLNRRSNSLTPGSHESLVPGPDIWSSQESLLQLASKPRSFSLSNDKTLLPININQLQSSSSETRLQDLQTLNNSSDMKSIVSWLKSLRLHKYSWVFNNLNYEQMLNLTEETLQSIGITKGARHKLLLSIGKLRERQNMLCELETEVMNGGDLLNALKKLKGVLQTPLQVTMGEDLSSLVVKVFGKVCTQLLMRRQSSEECFHLFTSLSERVENSDVFTDEQKRRMSMWKDQISKINHLANYNRHSNNYKNHHCSSQNATVTLLQSSQSTYSQKSSSYPNMQKPIGGHRHSVGNLTVNNFVQYLPLQTVLHGINGDCRSRSNNTNSSHLHVRFQETSENEQQTKSNKQLLKNVEIESSLESLCLQMMEHALGP
nr:protein Smaug homolog 2 [Onthophagus taurus]